MWFQTVLRLDVSLLPSSGWKDMLLQQSLAVPGDLKNALSLLLCGRLYLT